MGADPMFIQGFDQTTSRITELLPELHIPEDKSNLTVMRGGIFLFREMRTRQRNEEGWVRSNVSGYKQVAEDEKGREVREKEEAVAEEQHRRLRVD
jgi:hypothetical protein